MTIIPKLIHLTKTCVKCQQVFYRYYEINGKLKDLLTRKECLSCLPWKAQKPRKTSICKQCGDHFRINFRDERTGKYIQSFERDNCFKCKPLREDISHLYDKVKDNYAEKGCKWCMKEYGLTRNQIAGIVAKFDLEVNKEILSNILSEAKITPFEKQKVNVDQFKNIENPISAYILGLLWTDGHVSKRNNSIVFSNTFPDFNYFETIFKLTGNWGKSISKSKNTWKDHCVLYTSNKFLKDFLVEHNFQNKELGFSKIYNLIPNKYKIYFIRGLIDGDGCFYSRIKTSQFNFSLCSSYNQNWDCFEEILRDAEINWKIERTKSKSGSYSKIHISGRLRIIKFGDFIYQNYNNDKMGLERKYNKYLEAKNYNSKRNYKKTLFFTPQ